MDMTILQDTGIALEFLDNLFDTISEEIEKELAKLEWCDLLIWQLPLWWFGLPATNEGAEKR